MKYKKSMIMLVLVIFIFGVASVCASDVNDTVIAGEDASQIELSAGSEQDEDNLKTIEDNIALTQGNDDESVGIGIDSDVLGDDIGNYSGLSAEISAGGNIVLKHNYYIYDYGSTIEIRSSIDGNGAIIDMARSPNMQAFIVGVSGVTIKNLTIKNAKYEDMGAAIHSALLVTDFTVTNCNFINNTSNRTGHQGGVVYFSNNGVVTNCNFTDNTATRGGALFFDGNGVVTDCNFVNNNASSEGGALFFDGNGVVRNCNFGNNNAFSGGAVYFTGEGNVTNCNFIDNYAYRNGGAVNFFNAGTVTNCNFTGSSSSMGGAVCFWADAGTVTNCNFADNSADSGGAIYSSALTTADACIFKTDSDTTRNTHNIPPILNVDNFTTFHGSGEKLTFDLKTNSSIPVPNGNISISVYFKDNGDWVGNYSCLSGEGWIPDLLVGYYYAIFDTEYAEFQPVNRTITITMPAGKYYVNVTSLTTNNKTVNITARTNVPNDIIWNGKLLFILPNGANITANYAGNGTWWAEHTFDLYGSYVINATYIGLDNVTVRNATITINKMKTLITGNDVTVTYNDNKYLVITLKDADGKPLTGVKLTVNLNVAKTLTTDKNGQVKVSTKGLAPKTYTAKITFAGDSDHDKSTKSVKITVKKAKPKIIAKKKTYKAKAKTKKLKITLKDNTGKPIKNAKVRLMIKKISKGSKKKTKSKANKKIAKTNKNGKATFKVKINKKAKYLAYVKFYANKYYMKTVKKIKITIK